MTMLRFDSHQDYIGSAAVVPFRLFPPNGVSFTQTALLDTGAFMSFFDRALAPRLGIADLTAGRPTGLTAASGEAGQGYSFDLPIEVWGRRLTVPVAFCPAWPAGTRNLLGMDGFFDQYPCIAFAHASKRIFY